MANKLTRVHIEGVPIPRAFLHAIEQEIDMGSA
jgi:hypothetical protein